SFIAGRSTFFGASSHPRACVAPYQTGRRGETRLAAWRHSAPFVSSGRLAMIRACPARRDVLHAVDTPFSNRSTVVMSQQQSPPLVGVIMGSKSDWETMRHADEMLTRFGVPHECHIVSAHRTPDWMREYATEA